MKKPFAALLAMNLNLEERTPRLIMHAMRSVLIMSAASLLFACGSGTTEVNPSVQTELSTNLTQPDQYSLETAMAQAELSTMAQAELCANLSQPGSCSDVATIAAGMRHTVGLKEDGTVVAVGNNDNGQLDVSLWTNIKAIAAGWYFTVGLKKDGTVVAVGTNGNGQVSSWTKIKAIAAGAHHTVGLKEDGTVMAIGNDYGQLNVSSWKNIKAIAAGVDHTVGLKEDGTVVAVGNKGYGKLDVSSWTKIKAIAAGENHTVGLKEDGTVTAIGDGESGQLNVDSWKNIKAIAAGEYYTVGLKENGEVIATGELDFSSWTNIKAIAAGVNHTVGLKEDGKVVAVGDNTYNQLNVTSWENIMLPVCEPVLVALLDIASPVTKAVITGTPGNNGWYVSDVQMTLTATDNDCGLGVMEIYYSIDGIAAKVQGSSVSHSIVGDGTHTVTWFAVDNAKNAEKLQEMTINIDKTPPSISSLFADPAILWPPNHKRVNVFIGGSAADGGSGIASTIITVTDEYGIYNSVVSGFGNTIQLESWRAGTDRDGRVYTITAVTTDQAGNHTTGTATVVVPHDDRRRGRHHHDQDHHDKDNRHDRDHHNKDIRYDRDHHDKDNLHDRDHHDQARR